MTVEADQDHVIRVGKQVWGTEKRLCRSPAGGRGKEEAEGMDAIGSDE